MQQRCIFLNRYILAMFLIVSIVGCSTALINADTFSYDGLKRGSTMSQNDCQFPDTSVWVFVDGEGECIRYFHAGLKQSNPIVHVWFHGDRLKTVGKLKDGNVEVISYHDNSLDYLQQEVISEYEKSKTPYIRLSRPGVYGSSGDHKKRRLPREVNIVNTALNEIKKKYNIGSFILSGQSSGGHMVGSLLSLRDDISCAVITSGLVSVTNRNSIKGWSTDATGYSSYYDPIAHVNKIVQNNKRPIFIVGDPDDNNVPFSTQEGYFNELKKFGHKTWLIRSKAANHHSLESVGFQIVKMWFSNISPESIARQLTQ